MKPAKEQPQHKDKLGRTLAVGDVVCYPQNNGLDLGTVKKLNPKMVTVWEASARPNRWYTGSRKYSEDLIKVEGPEVTMYLLKLSNKDAL